MTDKEIVERAKAAEKRTGFGELVHSPISSGVNSAYGIGFIEGMVEYRNSLPEETVSSIWHDASEAPKPNMELICIGQYGNPLVLSSNSNSFKNRDISKWAYFNDLLNLFNVERNGKNWKLTEEQISKEIAEKFARIIRGNLSHIDDNVIHEFERIYRGVTGEKMFGGFKD